MQETKSKSDKQIVGNTGMYYVCYKLSEIGWNVMPTARNARGIDVVAYSPDGKDFLGVQVKTLSRKNPISIGASLDKIMGDYWVVVVLSEMKVYGFYPEDIKNLAHRQEKNGKASYWVETKAYMQPEYEIKWNELDFAKILSSEQQ